MLLGGLAGLQVGLQLADINLTKRILAKGGSELNPIIKAMGSKWAFVKIGAALGITGIFYYLKSTLGLVCVDGLMAGVIIWNLIQLRKS